MELFFVILTAGQQLEHAVEYLMHHLQFTLSYFYLQMNLYTCSYQKILESMNVLLSI